MKNNYIKINQVKLYWYLLGIIVFLFLSFLITKTPNNYTNFLIKDPYLIFITGIISLIFFGLGFIVIISVLIKSYFKKTGLIISEVGVFSNITFPEYGLILWEDVNKIETITDKIENPLLREKSKDISQIIIYLKEPQSFINKFKNIKKFLLNISYNKYKSPIVVHSQLLNCSFEELEAIILEYWNKYNERK